MGLRCGLQGQRPQQACRVSIHQYASNGFELCLYSLISPLFPPSHREAKSDKSAKEITSEIQAIMRQITASVTFLPLLNEPCAFDLLVYADKEATVPVLWEDSDPCLIQNGEQVKMRSFNTKVSSFVRSVLFLDFFV